MQRIHNNGVLYSNLNNKDTESVTRDTSKLLLDPEKGHVTGRTASKFQTPLAERLGPSVDLAFDASSRTIESLYEQPSQTDE